MGIKELLSKRKDSVGTLASRGMKIFFTLERKFNQFVELLTLICGLMIFLFMFIITAEVIGRRFFSKPLPGTFELGEFMLAFVVFFSMARVLLHGMHLRVTLAIDLLPGRYRRSFNLFSSGLGFVMMALISRYSLPFALRSFFLKETGLSFPIPLYPSKFAFFAGSTLFCISFLLEFINHLITATADPPFSDEEK